MNGKHDRCKMTKPFTITSISACNKRIFIAIYHFHFHAFNHGFSDLNIVSLDQLTKKNGNYEAQIVSNDLTTIYCSRWPISIHIFERPSKKSDEPKLNSTGILVVRCLYIFVYLGIFDAVPDHMPVEQVSLKLVTVSIRVKYPYEMVLQVCLELLWHHF